MIEAVAAHHADWDSFSELDVSAAVRVSIALAGELTGANHPADGADLPPDDVVVRLGLTDKMARVRSELSGALPKLKEGAS